MSLKKIFTKITFSMETETISYNENGKKVKKKGKKAKKLFRKLAKEEMILIKDIGGH